MFKKSAFFLILILSVIFSPISFALEKPAAPSAPSAPSAPEAPAPPDVSGVYDVPERPGMKVRVFAHPAKPTPPPAPGRTPNPSPSPTVAVNDSLVCSLTDPESSSTTGKAGWRIPTGNWTYQLNLASVPSTVGGTNLNNIVRNGLDQYTSATDVAGNKVTFVRGTDTSVNRARLDGRNIITWARASNGTLGVTYVWYYTQSGLTAEIDTIMNNRYKWSLSNDIACADNASYDAKNIMTHELGHWLGLDDEYDAGLFGNNTMYGYGSLGEVKKNTLTEGDKAGISTIY